MARNREYIRKVIEREQAAFIPMAEFAASLCMKGPDLMAFVVSKPDLGISNAMCFLTTVKEWCELESIYLRIKRNEGDVPVFHYYGDIFDRAAISGRVAVVVESVPHVQFVFSREYWSGQLNQINEFFDGYISKGMGPRGWSFNASASLVPLHLLSGGH